MKSFWGKDYTDGGTAVLRRRVRHSRVCRLSFDDDDDGGCYCFGSVERVSDPEGANPQNLMRGNFVPLHPPLPSPPLRRHRRRRRPRRRHSDSGWYY